MKHLVLLVLTLFGYGIASAQIDEQRTKIFGLHEFNSSDKLKLKLDSTYNLWVAPTEVDCITYDFTQQIKLGPVSSPTAIPIAPMEFTRASYDQAIEDASCPEDSTAIVIHFGLQNTSSGKIFDVALEFVCLDHQGNGRYTYVAPEVHYTINNGALVRTNGGISSWKSNWTNFKNNIVFKDDLNGTSFRAYDAAKDVEYVVFPETEIRQLISDNGMTGTDKFKLKPTAEPTATGNRAFRQGIVWIPMNVVLTNTIDPTKPFYQKGADLGSPCPSLCPPNIIFRTNGERVRDNCPPR